MFLAHPWNIEQSRSTCIDVLLANETERHVSVVNIGCVLGRNQQLLNIIAPVISL